MKKKGISLIVLIITIIVIIILAGAVILNLSRNNPIDSAKKAKFLNDIDTFKSELSLYELDKMANTDGNYDPKLLNADKDNLFDGSTEAVPGKNMTDVIESMKNTGYENKLEIVAGELVYVGDSEKESSWCDGVIESKDFKIDLTVIPDVTSLNGTITLTGAFVDPNKIEYYRIYISETSGNYPDTFIKEIKQTSATVTFSITEGIEANKTYYIKAVVKMNNVADTREKEVKVVSNVDNIAPNAAQIAMPSYSNNLTITPIAITLSDNDGGSGVNKTGSKYVLDKISTNYVEGDSVWDTATVFNPVDFVGNVATIAVEAPNDGEYYLHVLTVDGAGNKKSATSGKIVVDTIVPNEPSISIPSNAATSNIQATVTMSDNTNGSGLDLTNCKYIYSTVSTPYGDTDNIWNTATVFTNATQTITVTSSTNEVYYLHVLLVDKAGNRREVLSSGVTTNTDVPVAPVITGTIASNTWTNSSVTLTVNEVVSAGIVRYEYNVNDGSWQTYNSTNKIVVSTEGTIYIKARAVNNVGTNGAISIGYVVRIDKVAPTITASSGGSTANSVTIVSSASDSGSGINNGSYQYSLDNGSTWTGNIGSYYYTFNNIATGTYNCKVRVSDNAGNSTTSNTVSITAIEFPQSNAPGTEASPGTPKTENTTINGKTPTYNNPVIPAGFSPVDTSNASWNLSNGIPQGWNDGLVIQDTYGNQFVWVPVDGVSVPYAKWCTNGKSYAYTNEGTMPSGYSESNITSKYKGFYIARFEASSNGGKAASKIGSSWTYVTYYNAKSYSDNMATNYGYNTTLIGTTLITGIQWDTVIKWVQNAGFNVEDSIAWGNYFDAEFSYIYPTPGIKSYISTAIMYTGSTPRNSAKNIYDMAGNMQEWSNETYSSDYVMRGGQFGNHGNVGASNRDSMSGALSYGHVGFRPMLYIK